MEAHVKFRYRVSVDTTEGRTYDGTIMELDEETATRHAGRKFDHLEPMDKDAKAFLEQIKNPGEKAKAEKPLPKKVKA